jgi:hypothetical protein
MPTPQPVVMEGSPVVRALAEVWATIRRHHPELPEVVIVVGAGLGTKQHLRRGHFAAMRWQRDDQRRSEIVVSGEGLIGEAVGVLGTILHEAAHALAHVRNISDTSRRGRCHNGRFAELAEELGLGVEHDSRLGWSSSTPTTASIERYRTALDNLDRALRIYRRREPTGGANRASSTNPVALACACDGGRRIRVSRTTLGSGPIICQACGSPFDPH